MVVRFFAVVLLVSIAACSPDDGADTDTGAPVPGANVPVEEVAAVHGDAVWRVETSGCGWEGSGSAFAIDPHRLITNRHVIANDTSPVLRSRSGEQREGRVIGADPERDVAVIAVDDPVSTVVTWAPTPSLQRDERIVVIGYPRPEHLFTVSYGSILAFAKGSDDHGVLLSDAPIDLGNSGGPALRGDGTVVGVVTRVVLDDPTQHAAIVYTADRVAGAVEDAIEHPTDVESDCGLGPDYTPPLPEGIDITEPPPPPAPAVTTTAGPGGTVTVPTSASPPLPPLVIEPAPRPGLPGMTPETTARHCPSGYAEAVVVRSDSSTDGDGQRRVTAVGTVTNRSSQSMTIESVEVTFAASEPIVVQAAPKAAELAPYQSTGWEATAIVPAPTGEEPPPSATPAWRWTDSTWDTCPTPMAGS